MTSLPTAHASLQDLNQLVARVEDLLEPIEEKGGEFVGWRYELGLSDEALAQEQAKIRGLLASLYTTHPVVDSQVKTLMGDPALRLCELAKAHASRSYDLFGDAGVKHDKSMAILHEGLLRNLELWHAAKREGTLLGNGSVFEAVHWQASPQTALFTSVGLYQSPLATLLDMIACAKRLLLPVSALRTPFVSDTIVAAVKDGPLPGVSTNQLLQHLSAISCDPKVAGYAHMLARTAPSRALQGPLWQEWATRRFSGRAIPYEVIIFAQHIARHARDTSLDTVARAIAGPVENILTLLQHRSEGSIQQGGDAMTLRIQQIAAPIDQLTRVLTALETCVAESGGRDLLARGNLSRGREFLRHLAGFL